MKQSISIEVEKETYEVGQAIAGLVIGLKAKKPIGEIVAGELVLLQKAVDGLSQIPAEFSEDKAAFAKAILIPIMDAIGAPVAPPAA